MRIAEANDHLACFNYERSDKPAIEVVRIVKGSSVESIKNCNEVIFVMEGRIEYTSTDFPDYEGVKGHILFLSSDTSFSEQVRLHWRRFRTVAELAGYMNYSPKQFNSRFTAVFVQTPHRWMMQGRAAAVYMDIVGSGKLFKQIAAENGFTSDSSFTRFCKLAFERTPSQIREEKGRAGVEM